MNNVLQMPIRLSDGTVVQNTPRLERLRKLATKGSNEPRTYTHATSEVRHMAHESNLALEYYEGSREMSPDMYEQLAAEAPPLQHNPAELDAYIRLRIQQGALHALKLLEDLIEGRIPASIALRAKYADKHLSRAGYPPITKVSRIDQHLTREDIEALKQRCSEASNEAKD